jgi:hypothetical protein
LADDEKNGILFMAWYKDLRPCLYFGFRPSFFLRAVGWLERGHSYAMGDFDGVLFSALAELDVKPWEPIMCMGYHSCTLCEESGDFTSSEMGVHNLFIPGEGVVFVAPELILHYMRDHRYKPPEEFRQAALACPPMGSPEYFKKLEENGAFSLVHPEDQQVLPMTFWQKIKTRLKRHLPPL